MAALYRGPLRGYRLNNRDRIVLGASLRGEAGANPSAEDAGAVAWSMMMRFQLMKMKWVQGNWDFGRFIQAFSQPVNPAWADPTGFFCKKHPASCTASRLARRKKLIGFIDAGNWEAFKAYAPAPAKFAQMFVDGELPNPFHEPIYDFAACSLTQKQTSKGSRPSAGINIGGNCFLRYQDLSTSERKYVVPGEVYVGAKAHLSVIWPIVIGLAGGIFLIWRRMRD